MGKELINVLAVEKRIHYNLGILNLLGRIIKHYPELRFCQILEVLNTGKDRFYEESKETFERYQKFIDENNIKSSGNLYWLEEGLKNLGYDGSGNKRLEV